MAKRPPLRNDRARRIFFGSLLGSFILIVATVVLGIRPIVETRPWQGKPRFDAANAYRLTDKLARGFPNRVPWRPERKGAAAFLKQQLREYGYEPRTIVFDEVIAGKKIEGLENIFGILPGKELPNEYVVVLAHYDITDTTIEGATDDASGVGTVLELARVLRGGPAPRRSIIFLLTDSEEFGAFWGAHNFIRQFPQARQIVAAVSLDFIAPGKQKDIMVLVDGLKSGYAPLWLRETAMASIKAVPYPAEDTRHALEFVQRALLIPPADHGAFLMAGIPAINLFGRSEDFAWQMGAIHHTPEDNMTNLRAESFEPYGKATEILLRSIDAMPAMLDFPWLRNSNYWKVSERHYLTGLAAWLIHFLLFVPFIVYVGLLVHGLAQRQRYQIFKVVRNEAKGFALLLSSLLMGYGATRALPNLDIITKYEMFPATQKSLMLYRPEYLVLGLVLAVIILIYFALSRLFATRADRASINPLEIQIRHSLLGTILGLVILMGFAKNSYLATLLLLPPAYLWMFMKNNRRFDSRLLNILLFAGGLVSFIAICIAMTSIFHVGVLYWYLFLATSYGLISVYAMVLALAVITVGIRILRNLIL